MGEFCTMQLTRYTDYGLRILVYMAVLPKGKKASIDELSEVYDISRNNVNKIVHQLGKAGILKTVRGKGGGFFLDKAPEQVNIGEVVELLENSLQIIDCNKPLCRILPACRLKSVLNEATTAFMAVLKRYTLQDLVKDKSKKLIQIFEM